MADAGASTHHLHVAGFGAALVAEIILVGDGTLPDIGDDLHIRMGMGRKARVRGDLIVIPDPEGAPAHPFRVVISREGEVVFRLQPTVVGAAQTVERSTLYHDLTLRADSRRCLNAPKHRERGLHINRNYRNSLFRYLRLRAAGSGGTAA